MKKILILVTMMTIACPVFAIVDSQEVQKAEIEYQQKLDKIKKKQELKCLKNPQICAPVQSANMTLGVAQKNIKIGASQDEVALAMGSPNIVTVDADGKETWVYDKVSSITSYNSSGFNTGIILVNYGKGKNNAQSSQKTLTIVLKFTDKKVSSFKYHMSSF